MFQFFKIILKGLLYILMSPFIVAIVLLAFVYGLFIFIYQLAISVGLFFAGKTIFSDYKEDIEAKKILGIIKQPQVVTPNEDIGHD